MSMTAVELRSNIHKIVDSIKNEQLLQSLYEFLKSRESSSAGVWDLLSEDEKKEVLLAFDESEKDENLASKDAFKYRT